MVGFWNVSFGVRFGLGGQSQCIFDWAYAILGRVGLLASLGLSAGFRNSGPSNNKLQLARPDKKEKKRKGMRRKRRRRETKERKEKKRKKKVWVNFFLGGLVVIFGWGWECFFWISVWVRRTEFMHF